MSVTSQKEADQAGGQGQHEEIHPVHPEHDPGCDPCSADPGAVQGGLHQGEMPPIVTMGESITILYREQCHSITKEVDELLDRATEGPMEPASTLKPT